MENQTEKLTLQKWLVLCFIFAWVCAVTVSLLAVVLNWKHQYETVSEQFRQYRSNYVTEIITNTVYANERFVSREDAAFEDGILFGRSAQKGGAKTYSEVEAVARELRRRGQYIGHLCPGELQAIIDGAKTTP